MVSIQKMLYLSTAHITQTTAIILDHITKNESGINIEGLTAYNKDDVGWFLYFTNEPNVIKKMPRDLQTIIQFARDHECDTICLDADYEPLPYLRSYNW